MHRWPRPTLGRAPCQNGYSRCDGERSSGPREDPAGATAATQEQARLSEERFRLLVESVRDYAIFMLDPDGHVATWNAGAERIKGYRADEIIGQHFSIFYPPEALARGWPEHELEVGAPRRAASRTRAGACARTAPASGPTSSSPRCATTGGELIGFSKVTRDLTERRRAGRGAARRARSASGCWSRACRTTRSSCSIPTAASRPGTPAPSASRATAPSEIIGQHFSRLLPAGGRIAARLAGARAGGRARATAASRTRAGACARTASRFWANVVITAVHDAHGPAARVRQGHARPDRARARCETLEAGGPAERRVPGHARPRAAQPAGADPQRRGRDGRARGRRTRRRAWARDVIERQVGHLSRLVDDLLDVEPHHQRQDRAAAASRSTSRPSWRARVEAARPLLEERRHDARRRPRRTAAARRRATPRGSPGGPQPAQQRGQVHAGGRPHLGAAAARRRRRPC